MKTFLLQAISLIFLVNTSFAPSSQDTLSQKSLPNIIFIMADQMRGDALGYLGNPNAQTPNLDKMAQHGVLFENFFVNNPVCTPSRISFFTGLRPHQHGVLTNLHQAGPLNTGTNPQKIEGTLLGYLMEKGYNMGWVGKNHTFPEEVLKDIQTVSIRNREPFRKYSEYVPPHWHSDFFWPEEMSYAQKNTEEAVDFIKKAPGDQPFFLHLSYFDPHPPYMAPAKYASKLLPLEMQTPEFIPPNNLSERLEGYYNLLNMDELTKEDMQETLRYYYASVAYGVDLQVGKILQTLEYKDIKENTIIIFTADHGDFMGHYGLVRKGMFLYDALLHVPFIVYAPGKASSSVRSQVMAEGVDLFPTLIDLTGGSIPEELPGRSLKPFLSGQEEKREHMVFASAAYSDLGTSPEPRHDPETKTPLHTRVYKRAANADNRTVMVRSQHWKLILNETSPPELYHLSGGRGETQNVADNPENAEVLQKLTKAIAKEWPWWAKN